MTIEQIEAEVLKLPVHHRARLAQSLITRLDEESEIEAAWGQEADRRYEAHRRGEIEAIPASQAMDEIRAELAR